MIGRTEITSWLSFRTAAGISWVRRREVFNGEHGPALVNGLTHETFPAYRRAATHERIARGHGSLRSSA